MADFFACSMTPADVLEKYTQLYVQLRGYVLVHQMYICRVQHALLSSFSW